MVFPFLERQQLYIELGSPWWLQMNLRLELESAPCPRDIHKGNWTQLPLAKLTHSRGITILMKGVMIHSRSTPTENNISLDVSIDKSFEGVWLRQMPMFARSWWLATNLNCILACGHFNQPTILNSCITFSTWCFLCVLGMAILNASWHWAALRHISDILEHKAAGSSHIPDSIQKDTHSNIIWNGWTNARNSNNTGQCLWQVDNWGYHTRYYSRHSLRQWTNGWNTLLAQVHRSGKCA